ncbi:NAD(P)H-dependent oxidoreductase [Streptomyces sp. E1N211]|uniref:NAD(P)H-dependent oxidoreductase n=1 Tax=Streptomyces sp. E1N211 TaxID=1851876 RepID=UPI001F4DD39F|nr:NAD(P)H-dependent oxidoreductase [Streptomyces sp. E1N211]
MRIVVVSAGLSVPSSTRLPGDRLASEAFDAVSGADALIVVTPVFSASYSGLFKSFFDALSSTDSEALTGMPVLIAATGGSARHSLVLDHALRPLFSYLRAVVVPTGVYAASEDWGAEGLDARMRISRADFDALIGGPNGTTYPSVEAGLVALGFDGVFAGIYLE